MKKIWHIFSLLFVCSLSVYANGGGDIHDKISRTASGKIYFFERFAETNINVQELDQFVSDWVSSDLNRLNIVSKEVFKDDKTGVIRLQLTHSLNNEKILEENSAISDSIISTAHYTLKFLIHNNKLKVVMDNMFSVHEGVTYEGETFRQTESIESAYDDMKQFETLVQSKAKELNVDKCAKLKCDIRRLQKQIKNLKGKNLDQPRNKKLLARYHEKKSYYDRLTNPESLQKEIDKDLEEVVDYTQIFQFKKWQTINSSLGQALSEWDLSQASN